MDLSRSDPSTLEETVARQRRVAKMGLARVSFEETSSPASRQTPFQGWRKRRPGLELALVGRRLLKAGHVCFILSVEALAEALAPDLGRWF